MPVKDVWLSWHAAVQCSQSGVKLYKNKSRTWPQIFWAENIMESRVFSSPRACISFLPAALVITKVIFFSAGTQFLCVYYICHRRKSERKQLHFLRESGTGAARQLTCRIVLKTIVHIMRRKIMIQMSELSKQEFAGKSRKDHRRLSALWTSEDKWLCRNRNKNTFLSEGKVLTGRVCWQEQCFNVLWFWPRHPFDVFELGWFLFT